MPGSSLKLWSLFWSAILRVLLNTFDRLSCVSGFNVHICFRTEPSRYGCHSWVEIWVRRVKLWTAGRTFGQFVILHAFTSCMSYCSEHVFWTSGSSLQDQQYLFPKKAVTSCSGGARVLISSGTVVKNSRAPWTDRQHTFDLTWCDILKCWWNSWRGWRTMVVVISLTGLCESESSVCVCVCVCVCVAAVPRQLSLRNLHMSLCQLTSLMNPRSVSRLWSSYSRSGAD